MDGKMSQLASKVAKHYGYSDISTFRGMWPIQPGVLEEIKLLPEVLDEAKKFRVIIDYDPEFTRALVQIFTDQTSRQGHPRGKIGDFVKSSGEVQ
nr:hypothetical protein [uncultured Dysosmobacter sp.]